MGTPFPGQKDVFFSWERSWSFFLSRLTFIKITIWLKYRGPIAKLQGAQKVLHGVQGVLQFPVPKNYTLTPDYNHTNRALLIDFI